MTDPRPTVEPLDQLICAAVFMARCDGWVDNKEIAAIEAFFSATEDPVSIRRSIAKHLASPQPEDLLHRLFFVPENAHRMVMVRLLVAVARADGSLSESEVRWILIIGARLGIPPVVIQGQLHAHKIHHEKPDPTFAYALLGLPEDTDIISIQRRKESLQQRLQRSRMERLGPAFVEAAEGLLEDLERALSIIQRDRTEQ